MKKLLSYLFFALVAISLAFVACKKDSKDEDKPDNGDGTVSTIQAANVEGAGSGIKTVKAFFEETNNVAASCDFKNNGFTLNLPNSVDGKHLQSVIAMLGLEEVQDWVSDKNAKCVNLDDNLRAYNNSGEELGKIYAKYTHSNASVTMAVTYVYADRNFTISGKEDGFEINCKINKGWNIVFDAKNTDLDERVISTQKPSAAYTTKWFYEGKDPGGGGGGGETGGTKVRFEKEKAYSEIIAMVICKKVGETYHEIASHEFGTGAGISDYYDIPAGNYYMAVVDEDEDLYLDDKTENFAEGKKYKVLLSDDGDQYTIDLIDEGTSKSVMNSVISKKPMKIMKGFNQIKFLKK